MLELLVRRLAATVLVLFGLSLLVFLMLRLVPGDPIQVYLGVEAADPALEQQLRRELGLDRPVLVQYARYVGRIVVGDLGRSILTRRAVLEDLLPKAGNTAQLAAASLAIALTVGISLGMLAAVRRFSFWDHAGLLVALAGISLPVFWTGLLLQWLFSVQLGLLPAAGKGGFERLILPAVTLSAPSIALVSRVTRASLLEIFQQDFVRVARAKGLSARAVLLRHVLPNGILPVITVVGLQFGYMLAGAVLTETVFAWPGLGRLIVDAIKDRDYPVVQGGVLLVGTVFVALNLTVDLLYLAVDPRLRRSPR